MLCFCTLLGFGLAVFAAPQRCLAEDDTPTIVGYALEGFGTGVSVGLASGFLATGREFESGEWRTVLLGGGIGALSGLGVGLVLGIVDAGTAPDRRGVGFYIMRDSNYGFSVGALAGGVVGALVWAGGGEGKDLLLGLCWGTVIGAGAGLILGAIEGGIRGSSHQERLAETDGVKLSLGVGFASSGDKKMPLPYPRLMARF